MARRTSSARASVFSDSPGGISRTQSAATVWSRATFVSVTAKRLPNPLGSEGPAAERRDAQIRPREQVKHVSLLAAAELVLALAVEERLDRLPEGALELAVGVGRALPDRPGHGARGARLAGPHESDEDEGGTPLGRGRAIGVGRRQRLHSIRSRYACSAADASSTWSPPNFS